MRAVITRAAASLAAALFGVVLLVGTAAAQDIYRTASAGGTGGRDFSQSCRADEVLVGISGRAGWYIDRVAAVCQRVGADGKLTGSRRTTGGAGGNGGQTFTRTCPQGQVVSSIRGRAASLVDRVQIACRPLNTEGRTSGSTRWLSAAGGNGGRDFGPLTCAGNRPAKAVQGRYGSSIDQIRLACAYPQVQTTATTVKQEFCFGAVGAQCGVQQGLAGFCAGGRCPVNAGSWEHDECCWKNPNGLACKDGPLDYLAPTRHRNVCAAEWDKAVAHWVGGLNWWRDVNFRKANTTGVVVHGDYCAPAGTIILAADARKCCSRSARQPNVRDTPTYVAQGVKNPADPNLRVCR